MPGRESDGAACLLKSGWNVNLAMCILGHLTTDVVTRYLRSGAAFHSHHMQAASEKLKTALESSGSNFVYQRTNVHLFSTVTGTCVSGRKLDPQYWKENLREPVEFSEAVTAAMNTHLTSQNKENAQAVRVLDDRQGMHTVIKQFCADGSVVFHCLYILDSS